MRCHSARSHLVFSSYTLPGACITVIVTATLSTEYLSRKSIRHAYRNAVQDPS